jgi:hypothetical protein
LIGIAAMNLRVLIGSIIAGKRQPFAVSTLPSSFARQPPRLAC